jgi:anion-transporting  ArsA/GET3 family ATPase
MARRAAAPLGVADLLAAKEMVVVCGSGGTGKTTIAAALGAQAALQLGGRVLVLTVDPARRLATALGLGSFGAAEVQVPPEAFAAAGVQPRGELWMAMLDTKAGWDELVRRHAPDAALREQVLANPLYRNITSRFVHSHDYIAMEKLHEVHASGRYDLVVIDTPPSRNALTLLDAPGRMREFFGSRLLRWLTVPYRSRLFTLASKPFYQVADRVLGSRFLQDIAEFFVLFQTMERGFVARAGEVELLLTDDRTTFVVVSTLEAAPAHEARFLAAELRRREMPLGAMVLNRVLPASIRQPAAAQAARKLTRLAGEPAHVAGGVAGGVVAAEITEVAAMAGCDPIAARAVLADVAASFHDTAVIAAREAERRRELAGLAPVTVDVPTLRDDIHDLAGLLQLGAHVVGSESLP